MQVYNNREITKNYQIGTLEVKVKGIYKLFDIQTKPRGARSNFISIGKLVAKEDELGDLVTVWEHHGYPKECPDIVKFKSQCDGKGSQAIIDWAFLIDEAFLDQGYAIALVGTGKGGRGRVDRGCRDQSFQIILDTERVKKASTICQITAKIGLESELKTYLPNIKWTIEGSGGYAIAKGQVSIFCLEVIIMSDGTSQSSIFVGKDPRSGSRVFHVSQPPEINVTQAVISMGAFLRDLGYEIVDAIKNISVGGGNKMNYKIGDRVKLVKPLNKNQQDKIGMTGVIVEVNPIAEIVYISFDGRNIGQSFNPSEIINE